MSKMINCDLNTDVDILFFDVGGVLYTLDYEPKWKIFCNRCGKTLQEVKDVLYAKDIFSGYETGKISSTQYYEAAMERLSCSMSFDEFKLIWNSFLIKREDMFHLVFKLKKHIDINFITNTNELNAEVIENDLKGITNNIVYSFQAGCSKPEQKIYKIALDRANTKPERSIFIDDREENVDGARSLGIISHLFKGKVALLKFLRGHGLVV